jgi:hypothetical protein
VKLFRLRFIDSVKTPGLSETPESRRSAFYPLKKAFFDSPRLAFKFWSESGTAFAKVSFQVGGDASETTASGCGPASFSFRITLMKSFIPFRGGLARHGLAIVAVAAALAASPAVADGWTGFMNVFNNASGSQGSFVFGSGWGVSDIKTTVITSNTGTIAGDQLRLQPNYNTYTNSLAGSDGDRAFWTDSTDGGVTPGPNGNKWMDANTSVETNPLAVPSYTLSGTVDSSDLNRSLYTPEAFIKVLDPGAGFATVLNDRVVLPTSGPFTVTADLSLYQGMILQAGFTVSGLNANPVNEASFGGVTVSIAPVPEPAAAGLALAGLAGLAGLVRARRRI